jgi:branched-chain amino acid transport system substrate-binding protein
MTSIHGEVEMRAADHQLLQPLWISSWAKVGGPNKHDIERTGYTWKTRRRSRPTSRRSPPAAT